MKRLFHFLLVNSLLFLVPATQTQAKHKPKGGSPCSQGTPYRNCRACGTTSNAQHQKLNVLKNRDVAVTNPRNKTVQDIRNPNGNFSTSDKVLVTGFVASVDPGGLQETCNCKRIDLRDVHINIVADPSEVGDKTKYVIVEFTPRWEKTFGFDDSNYDAMRSAVQTKVGGKWVKFQGYMMDDWVHKKEAKNTADPGTPTCTDSPSDPTPCVWRATTWEVHPVTAYSVVPGP